MICFACALLLVSFYGSAQSVSYRLFSACPFHMLLKWNDLKLIYSMISRLSEIRGLARPRAMDLLALPTPLTLLQHLKKWMVSHFFINRCTLDCIGITMCKLFLIRQTLNIGDSIVVFCEVWDNIMFTCLSFPPSGKLAFIFIMDDWCQK